MAIIAKEEIDQLIEHHNSASISIYIPTHRVGKEVSQKQDALQLKNELKAVVNKLEDHGYQGRDIQHLLKPAYDLLEDTGFWNQQSDGLVLFLSEDFSRHFSVPIHFEPFSYVSSEFYVKPLLPLVANEDRFFILSLKLDEVKFYEGSAYEMQDVFVKDLTPERLEDVVGYDFKEKSLQFRGGHDSQGRAMYHGHNVANDEDKEEIRKYLRAVNDGLMKMLHDEKAPLVVACTDYLFPIYKEVNTYNKLYEKAILKNPSEMDRLALHSLAKELLSPEMENAKVTKVDKLNECLGTPKASTDIKEIIPAAIAGKVDALFLEKGVEYFGIYNPNDNDVSTTEEMINGSVSLTNMAASEVYSHGGKVFITEGEEISGAQAVYRY